MTDRQDLVEYDGGQLSQYEDVGSDVREAFERHKSSTEVIEHDSSRSLGDVIRSAVNSVKNKGESRARQEHGSGASLERHWDRLPKGVKADVRDLAQWRDYYARFTPFAQLCQKNGTDLYTALTQYNRLENAMIADPVSGTMAIWDRLGLDRLVMVHAANQYIYDPQSWAAQQINNVSYQQGASNMAGAAMNADISAFIKANPGAEHFRNEMAAQLSYVNFPAGTSNWQMLAWAYNEAVKDAGAKERVVAKAKRAGKAVGGAPSSNRISGSTGGGSSTADAIREAINAQRGTV
jgi:hypothetical protein